MKIAIPARQIDSIGVQQEKEYSIKLGAHTMMLFSDLYSDPKWAIVREYATNMLDGYTKLRALNPNAKIIAPEIHLPNTLEPFIRFKDFGIGMDYDTVWNVFTSYGDSTKQDNNDEVGGLGIGSKVAFAYRGADQWVIESRYHGKRMIFNALKNQMGIPTLQHIQTVDTDEPNGVTIQIPVARSDFYAFKQAVERLAMFYPMELSVIGNPDYKKPKLDYFMRGASWGLKREGQSQVIMGNIPYPLDLDQLPNVGALSFLKSNKYNAVHADLYMPVGSVGIVPSREALLYSEQTKAALSKFMDGFVEEVKVKAEKDVATATTFWEALSKLHTAYEVGGLRTFLSGIKWKGQTLSPATGITFDLKGTDPATKAHITPSAFKKFPDLYVEVYRNEQGKAHFSRTVPDGGALVPGEKVHVYVDDTTKYNGAVRRVRKMLTDLYVETRSWGTKRYAKSQAKAYVFKAEGLTPAILSEILGGFPVYHVTSLPEPVYDRSSGPRKKTSVKVFNYESSDNWDDAEIEVEDGGYYVRLEGGEIMGDQTDWSLNHLLTAGKTTGILPKDFKVYGIPRTLKSIENKDGWEDFFDWFKPQAEAAVKRLAKDAAEAKAWEKTLGTTLVQLSLDDKVAAAVLEAKPRSPLLKLREAAKDAVKKQERTQHLLMLAQPYRIKVTDHKPTSDPAALVAEVQSKHPALAMMADMASSHYKPVEQMKKHLPAMIKLLGVTL
jgi:hypothetical protein